MTARLSGDERALLEALWYDHQLVEPKALFYAGRSPHPCSGTRTATKRVRYQGFADEKDARKLLEVWSAQGLTPDILDLTNGRPDRYSNKIQFYVYAVLSLDDEKALQEELERRGQARLFVLTQDEDDGSDGLWVTMDADPKECLALIDACQDATLQVQTFPENVVDRFKSAWKKQLRRTLGKAVKSIRSPRVAVYRAGELPKERILVAVDPTAPKTRPRYLVLTRKGTWALMGNVYAELVRAKDPIYKQEWPLLRGFAQKIVNTSPTPMPLDGLDGPWGLTAHQSALKRRLLKE